MKSKWAEWLQNNGPMVKFLVGQIPWTVHCFRSKKIDWLKLLSHLHRPQEGLCNIIVRFFLVFSTGFHLTNFFGEEKFRALPSKNRVADEILPLSTSFFSWSSLFLEGHALYFSSPKKIVKWKQVKITNVILQRHYIIIIIIQVLYRFDFWCTG